MNDATLAFLGMRASWHSPSGMWVGHGTRTAEILDYAEEAGRELLGRKGWKPQPLYAAIQRAKVLR